MLRKHFMNGLIALVAVGAVLTGYNAFVADSEDGHSATSHVAEYLALDVDRESTPSDETTVATNDGATPSTETPATDTNTQAPAEEPSTDVTPETATSDESTPPTTTGSDKPQTVYTVKEGDTYGCIAEKYYGSFEHWPDVVAANPYAEGYMEYELHVGAQIVLPAVQAGAVKPASSLCS